MAETQQQGANRIARLEKGSKDRTAMHASVMNEIIDAINKMLNLTVSPQGSGKFIWSDSNGVLQLGAGAGGCGAFDPPASGTFVCGSVDGVKQWLNTQECACTELDGGDFS